MADASIAPLDRLPAEIRVQVWELVVSCELPLVVANEGEHDCIALLIALVNDQKYIEAYDAFYSCNTFRITEYGHFSDMTMELKTPYYGPFSHITKLELTNFFGHVFIAPKVLDQVLEICSEIPKLKSLILSYDSLCGSSDFRCWISEPHDTLARKLVCVGVGRFELLHRSGLLVEFVHYSLTHAWRELKTTERKSFAEIIDGFTTAYNGRPASERQEYGELVDDDLVEAYLEKASLGDFVACFDEFHSRDTVPTWPCYSIEDAVMYYFGSKVYPYELPEKLHRLIAAGVSLRDLDGAVLGGDLLEELTGLLLFHERYPLHLERPWSRHYNCVLPVHRREIFETKDRNDWDGPEESSSDEASMEDEMGSEELIRLDHSIANIRDVLDV
ncbi:hypothetical protein LTR17_013500 [Elasticomyces elasticus]|nr:hypothetical protein LTR17_013500 [Elasticomyces elasticus]